jgi:hypothetical protein
MKDSPLGPAIPQSWDASPARERALERLVVTPLKTQSSLFFQRIHAPKMIREFKPCWVGYSQLKQLFSLGKHSQISSALPVIK